MSDAVTAAPATHRPLLARYVRVVAQPRTWLTLLWMLLGLPLGIATFTVAVTGYSLGLGLAITIVGIPLLVGMLFLTRAAAALDGRLTSAMLGAGIRPASFASPAARPGMLARVGANLRDSLTWRGLAFMLLRLPLGIATFTIAVTILSVIAALVSAPFTYQGGGFELFSVRADTLADAALCSVVGLLLAPAALHALNAVGWLAGRFSRLLLQPRAA